MTFTLSFDAAADLDKIYDYTAGYFGTQKAEHYLLQLKACCARLSDFTKSGTSRPDMGEDCYMLIHKEHRIYYQIQASTILIIRVLHHAQQDVH